MCIDIFEHIGLKSTRAKETTICIVQIKIFRQTYIEQKYGAFYLNNKVGVHELVLLVQLS